MTQQSSAALRVGVVGVGHLGKNHARIYHELPEAQLVGIADPGPAAQDIADQFQVPCHKHLDDLIPHVDAVSIVTPTPFHLETARPFIEAGKSVLVEKPLANTLEEADELVKLADDHGVVLQVGHIERFNPVLTAAFPYVKKPLFIECDRIHPFSLRSTEVSVVLDLMIHDIDLVLHLADDELDDVDALGTRVLSPSEDLAIARLSFSGGCTAMVKTSRVALNRSRKIRIFADRSYISLDLVGKRGSRTYLAEGYDPADFVDESGRLKVDEGEADFLQKVLRFENIEIGDAEPLKEELKAFIDSVTQGTPPAVSGIQGRRAMAAADRIQQSIEAHRKKVQ